MYRVMDKLKQPLPIESSFHALYVKNAQKTSTTV